jgi:uncharacterized protein YaiE (UPF0345 family)
MSEFNNVTVAKKAKFKLKVSETTDYCCLYVQS